MNDFNDSSLNPDDCLDCRGRGRTLDDVCVFGIETKVKLKYIVCQFCGGAGKQKVKEKKNECRNPANPEENR